MLAPPMIRTAAFPCLAKFFSSEDGGSWFLRKLVTVYGVTARKIVMLAVTTVTNLNPLPCFTALAPQLRPQFLWKFPFLSESFCRWAKRTDPPVP
jgi:hypothetical protein